MFIIVLGKMEVRLPQTGKLGSARKCSGVIKGAESRGRPC